MTERQPQGIPTGGQFAPERKPEPLTSLGGAISDEDYNREATWQFPPRPRSARQHIAFWASTPIPDDVLSNMTRAFYLRNANVLVANHDKLDADFKKVWLPQAKNLVYKRDSNAAIDAEERRMQEAFDAYRIAHAPDYLGETPLKIDQTDARTIARAALMYDAAQQTNRQFTQDEKDAVLDFPVELTTGTTTVYGVEETYRLWAMRETIQQPGLSTADVVRKLEDLEAAIEGRE